MVQSETIIDRKIDWDQPLMYGGHHVSRHLQGALQPTDWLEKDHLVDLIIIIIMYLFLSYYRTQ